VAAPEFVAGDLIDGGGQVPPALVTDFDAAADGQHLVAVQLG
jgi:hypothetical protein